ncbi:MAG: thioredoxin, partial [Alphaproteobacteria bacterium]|nr:thioredoxin [Alphaproteobacteria bacterium]
MTRQDAYTTTDVSAMFKHEFRMQNSIVKTFIDRYKMALPLTSDHFNMPHNTLKNLPGQVVVMFYRPTCPACKAYHPQYSQLAQKMNAQAASKGEGPMFFEVDTSLEENRKLMQATDHPASTFKIQYVPT